jgi:hypothetical protein
MQHGTHLYCRSLFSAAGSNKSDESYFYNAEHRIVPSAHKTSDANIYCARCFTVLTAEYLGAGCKNILLVLSFETLQRKRRDILGKIRGFKAYRSLRLGKNQVKTQ